MEIKKIRSREIRESRTHRFSHETEKEYKLIPKSRKTVKQMVQEYEDNIILPPPQFRDNYKPVPLPRTKKTVPEKPVPLPRTKIELTNRAIEGFTKSFEVSIKSKKRPCGTITKHQKDNSLRAKTEKKLLNEEKGFKFVETLKVTFEKTTSKDQATIRTAYFRSNASTIINENEIAEEIEISKQQIMNTVAQWISESSGWIIESLDSHYINIIKYNPLKGSSYIKLPQELKNSAKGLINMKNSDNECFRWCHIRHLNPQGKHPERIKKFDKEYIKNLDYSGIEFPVTINQINKIEKRNNIRINVLGYEQSQPFPVYISKENHQNAMNLLLITGESSEIIKCKPTDEEWKNRLVIQTFYNISYERKTFINHYVLIKDFNNFMFNQTKHEHRKHFCFYCL